MRICTAPEIFRSKINGITTVTREMCSSVQWSPASLDLRLFGTFDGSGRCNGAFLLGIRQALNDAVTQGFGRAVFP